MLAPAERISTESAALARNGFGGCLDLHAIDLANLTESENFPNKSICKFCRCTQVAGSHSKTTASPSPAQFPI